MIKSILIYAVVFALLYFLGVYLHSVYLEEIPVTISLHKTYLVHSISSFVLCSTLLILSYKKNLFNQLGFIYIGGLVFKLTVFSMLFKSHIFSEKPLQLTEKMLLIVPVFVFLILEVIFIANILNKKPKI